MEVSLTEMARHETRTPQISAMIVGAEKAGTSTLIAHLGSIPGVCVPMLSGSRFDVEFASEFPYFLSDNANTVKNLNSVLIDSLPSDFDPEHQLVVAKNVGMCTDREAMDRLLKHSPNVKVIFILREPISRAVSAHRYQLFRGAESETDFSCAAKSSLDNMRHADRHIDYLRRGLYSDQVANLIDIFGRKNCLFLCFDDLVSYDSNDFESVRKFIGLTNGSAVEIEKVNAAKKPRSSVLARFLYRESVVKSILRQVLPLRARIRFASTMRRLNSSNSDTPPLEISDQLRVQLHDYFRNDLEKTEMITGLDLLDRWGY